MALDDWMPALAQTLTEVSGVEAVYYPSATGEESNLPGQLAVFPCLVILPERGTQHVAAGGPNEALHRVRVTLYAAAQVLPEAYGVAMPLIVRVLRKLATRITLGGLVAHCLPVPPPESWYEGPGAVVYGQTETGAPRAHLGVIFRLEVKEHETLTVSA